jgi:hypothetical protein
VNLDSLTNRGEYLSAHYLAEILPGSLKGGVLKQWSDEERHDKETPRTRLRALRRTYNALKSELAELDPDAPKYGEKLRELHRAILAGLGFPEAPEPRLHTVERAGQEHTIPVVHSEPGIVVIESGWATDADAAADPDGAGRPLDPVTIDPTRPLDTAAALASYLLLGDDQPPRYVLILNGAVVTLADRLAWFEGRYLAVSLDVAYGRNDTAAGGELDVIAALFGAESLRPPPEGGTELLATLRDGSRQHAIGVSSELREGLRLSVEVIANEVLHRIRDAGVQPDQIMDPAELGKELASESLRYLYRILFLLYAEARRELGVLPVNDDDYLEGYSLARLGEVVSRKLVGESAERGFHLYESLDLLFRMVNDGHNPRGATAIDEKASEGEGIRFEPLKSDLFLPEKTRLIGREAIVHPDYDEDDPTAPRIDTRLRNACLHQVLRWLMIARGKKKGRGGFISYAQLGINQLGAVYEGLMSYTGFIATEELYEVAKKGDPKDGSWMIPASKVDEYPDEVFVERTDEETGVRSRVRYGKGAFVYRLAGRDRQTSASYYTPQSLTEVTVQLALKYRLEEEGREVAARELLDWTICEPALGSGAFLNEAINQVAAEYLRRAQKERGETLDPEQYAVELQKVKAYIALHNCYGVDLNRTAVELAEVSLWLNTMHPGLQAPWFGLHLRRGNSLIGCGRKTYTPEQLGDKSWLKTAPEEHKLRDGDLPEGVIHHFLLPADGWGVVASNKEARSLAPEDTATLAAWRRSMHKTPVARGKRSQVQRLQALSRRVEYLWKLVLRRLEISEREIRRDISVWGADDLPPVPAEAVLRDKVLRDLESTGTPYWRLKTVMDTWCALWFWPLDQTSLLDGSAPAYQATPEVQRVTEEPVHELVYTEQTAFDLGLDEQQLLPIPGRQIATRARKQAVALRPLVPLADLDDWIEFAEAMLGRHDIPPDSLHAQFESLHELEVFEDSLAGLMAMDNESGLADRFPWLTVATNIAADHGFFHWELTFAHAFANGGFDLQVGNPPWVRPDWNEDIVMAECEPWFALIDKPSVKLWQERKEDLLRSCAGRAHILDGLVVNVGLARFLVDPATFPLLAGTRPDLYRSFMARTWANLGPSGTSGLVHPDSHLVAANDIDLRASTYSHLRLHAHFVNERYVFPEIGHPVSFGVHVYARAGRVDFAHLSWLFDPATLSASLNHVGEGPSPGIKHDGKWDLRGHRDRIVRVTPETLKIWARLMSADESVGYKSAPIVYAVTSQEQRAIECLASFPNRLGSLSPYISSGYNEKTAKDEGLIRWRTRIQSSADELIYQGPHIHVANPYFKQPNENCRSKGDWTSWDLKSIPHLPMPRTNYERSCDRTRFLESQDVWGGRRYTEFFRVAWRRRIPAGNERSLFAALIPPGPAHVHTVQSMFLRDSLTTALVAGFWSSIPLDYLLRITGRSDLLTRDVHLMPAPDASHPLASALLLRSLRLNCLTRAYSPIWAELFDPNWTHSEEWVNDWPGVGRLARASGSWDVSTPLRSEMERRAALIEVDALVSVWLGLGCDELLAIYSSRFPIMSDYESGMWFDADGRKVAKNFNAFGYGQTREHYEQLMAHLDDPERNPVPERYSPPFYKADRENEYRQAHAVFSKRLQDAIDAGWTPS